MTQQANGADSQRTRSFNPNEHMLKLKSKEGTKDYLPVQWRLVWFRLECQGGTIDTEELQVDLDREVSMEVSAWNNETRRSEKVVKVAKGYARYKAIVTDGKGGRATGTKSESAVNFADYIEKAETGAIGRALAALGYGTQFTGDEFDEGERIVDSPAEQKPTKSDGQALHALTAPGSYEQHHEAPITDQQKASIRKLCEHLGREMGEDVATMTYQQAKDAILVLSGEYGKMRERPAPQPQANGHEMPTIKELQARCNKLFGVGHWQAMILKALKIEDPEITLKEDDLIPDDRESIAKYLDFAEQRKTGAGDGK